MARRSKPVENGVLGVGEENLLNNAAGFFHL